MHKNTINTILGYNFQFHAKCFYIAWLVKYEAELKVDTTFSAFEAKTFGTQVVAGTKFAVNVSIFLLFSELQLSREKLTNVAVPKFTS